MLEHPATQRNLRQLQADGWIVADSATGLLACGDLGSGKLPEPEQIAARVEALFSQVPGVPAAGGAVAAVRDYEGRRVTVTAGPTREAIDPVRYITNHSSGRMGYALAEAAAARGAAVTLISGPVTLDTPEGVRRIEVESAEEMYRAVSLSFPETDVLIMAAAVADYRPKQMAEQKLKKGELRTLELEPTTDILQTLAARKRAGQLICGFAMETEDLLPRAREKRRRKALDLICANSLREEGAGFAVPTNRLTLIDAEEERELGLMSKREAADAILSHLKALEQKLNQEV